MTRSRHRYVLLLVAVAALLAAACGGEVTDSDTASSTEPTDSDREAGSETTQPAPETTEPDGSDQAPEPEPETTQSGPDTDPDTAGPEPEPETTGSDTTELEPEPETTQSDTAAPESEAVAPNVFDDPRDGIFDEFQATMDRGEHPFMQLDAFCHAHDPATDRVATGAGIGADSISLVHLRSRIEDFVAFGFGTAVGDVAEMFDTFAAVVNEQCGGVRGRLIDMHTIEVGVMDEADQQANAACIEAVEDLDGVILVNSSGFPGSASLCIVEDHETAFVSVQTQPEEFMRRGEDRLVSLGPTAEEQLRWLALDLIAQGQLDGRTVAVAAPDTPGEYEAVKTGLVDVLEANGVTVAVFDVIGCQGGSFCTVSVQETVQRMRDRGVDVFFNVLNAVSAPGIITEMVAQGYEPDDVQFYASEFNAQAVEIVASKIVAFGGEAAGRLYDGAVIQSFLDTGAYRLGGYEPRVFNEMCNDAYGANSASGANHESGDRATGTSTYGMTVTVCEIMRIALRAVYDAGDNPTRADIYAALASLGPVDSNEMLPASLRPGKTNTPDVIHNLVFEYPCTKPYPFGAENVCLYPIDEYRPAPS